MNEFLFEMIIVGIMYLLVSAFCINYLIRRRVVDHETFERMSPGSCLICAAFIGLTILATIFEIVWFLNFLGGVSV